MVVRAKTSATEEFLAEVVARMRVEENVEKQAGLIPEAKALLYSAVAHPEYQVTRHYSEAGLTPEKGKKGVDALVAIGYGQLHHFCPRGRGGRSTHLEILEAANLDLASLGIQRPAPVLKGGWTHDVTGRLLRAWELSRGNSHWFEKTLGRKTFDCIHEENGKFIAWEVHMSGSADWAIGQAMKGLENEGILELRIICRDVKFEKELIAALKKLDAHEIYSDRIKTWIIGDLF
jgi:hypothetical protein